jgi:hypothetical protein
LAEKATQHTIDKATLLIVRNMIQSPSPRMIKRLKTY